MKTYLLLIAGTLLLLSACKEEPPYINYNKPTTTLDTAYLLPQPPTPQLKQVLIEDVSGVGCVNCPAAAAIAHDIVGANPGRVNVITVYPNLAFGVLVKPINHDEYISKYDFRTLIADNICNSISVPGSLPSGYINRKKFGSDWNIPKESWSAEVDKELQIATPVNIEYTAKYVASENKISIDLLVTYTQDQHGDNYLSVMLTQDSTIDVQETRDQNGMVVYDSVYVHQHALMDALTASTGDLLNSTPNRTLIAGRVFHKKFEKKLEVRNNPISGGTLTPPQWIPDLMKVVVFVTQGADNKYYVLQSKEVDVQ